MEDGQVSLVRCDDYRRQAVGESVARALALLGGPEAIARPGESVFLKVNAVIAAAPETGIVTHPEVVRAVVEEFRKVTDRVVIGDSPGGPFTRAFLKRVYEKTGLARVAEETGAELALDTRVVEVPFPGGRSLKRFTLCGSMVESDHLVSISKFKTNRYMNITGPIKNLYGAVPGMTKFSYHSRFESPRDFADLMVDVHLVSRPAFHIVDAVEAIDGDGARNGDIKRMRVIAAGKDAFALESLMMELAGLELRESMPLEAAIERGLCPGDTGWLTVLGDDRKDLAATDFRLPEKNKFSERVPANLYERFRRLLVVTPEPLPEICTGCGKCAEVCPRGAITVREGTAVVNAKKCIRCFCCDELCEYGAVGMRRPLLLRIAHPRGD